MAKTTTPKTDASSVNPDAQSPETDGAINAASPADMATPENTPIPGGGSWAWDHLHACWVESL